MGTSAEEGAKTLMAHRQVVQDLEHLNQDRNWYGEQHNRLQRAHHLETVTLIKAE